MKTILRNNRCTPSFTVSNLETTHWKINLTLLRRKGSLTLLSWEYQSRILSFSLVRCISLFGPVIFYDITTRTLFPPPPRDQAIIPLPHLHWFSFALHLPVVVHNRPRKCQWCLYRFLFNGVSGARKGFLSMTRGVFYLLPQERPRCVHIRLHSGMYTSLNAPCRCSSWRLKAFLSPERTICQG